MRAALADDGLSAYYATEVTKDVRLPCFNEYIGLSVEALPENVTMQSLWSVL